MQKGKKDVTITHIRSAGFVLLYPTPYTLISLTPWQTSVRSAQKAQKLLESTPTLFVLPNSTHAATVVYTLTYNGLVFLTVLVYVSVLLA